MSDYPLSIAGCHGRIDAYRSVLRVALSALTFYADPDNYEPRPGRVRPIVTDGGTIARTALAAGIENELAVTNP